ncbi:GH25 family lysozyme [Microlunatus flavus]|uniref:lysozyme n=1 Tax=Microlunatus flavus TaxID=1036181 RepID=A0A1H8ZYN8_9ACTN|nr:GH25 family lysozyme [Microlunatus flavus]SEP69363.1 Lyzozyme M1 (1,4-beta-N-acetylmuramidase), GH25 family [Microlunatus flavus]
MLVRHPISRSPRRTARRAVPALLLGVSALALAVPTTLPASAAPGGPADAPTSGATASAKSGAAKAGGAKGRHLTAEAREAGLEVGNATMGWRQRGTARPELAEPGSGLLRYGLAARASSSDSFTPKGVLGVDVSSYQGKLKWSTWTKKDRDFAYVKATEGSSYKNPYFKNQYGGAKKAGMVRGAYHFANPAGKAGYKQARYFVKNGGGWSADGHTLPGVLDIEYNPYGKTCYGVSKKKMVKWISSFTREYKKLTKKDAVIYTTTDWWTQCTGNSGKFATTNPLWIARYGTKDPGELPKGWKVATFWQYSSNPIDQDVFPSKRKRLKVLATEI